MANWRDEILKHFQPKISRLTLVADPDGLLSEERILAAIRDRGFDLVTFDDPVAFRFAFESQYRALWDEGRHTDLVVVLRSAGQQLSHLPYDLLTAGRQLTFALHQLFPKLNYSVVAVLDRTYLDAIDESYGGCGGEQLTERETKEFVLSHCFGIVPNLIKTPADLLKVLLSMHSRRVLLPEVLNDHLLERLAKDDTFATWPVADILPSREKFLRFLQDEWELFLRSEGRARVPFKQEDVRAYVDTLFLDGSLAPVEREDVTDLPGWARTGVINDPKANALRRFRGLWQKFEAETPGEEAQHRHWQRAAQCWAELTVLRWEVERGLDDSERKAWDEMRADVEDAFAKWVLHRYGSLYNLPYHHQPVMVHQIPHFLAVERTRKRLDKIALIVLDGLALDQWLLLRRELESSDPAWRFRESAAFAWVPTLTSVSRQAIFAGEPPLYFPDSLNTTSKERARWQRFWEDRNVQRANIELITNLEDAGDARLESAFSSPSLSVLGIVLNRVDDIMHGMQMQTVGMHDQVRLWGSQGHLQRLLARLHDEGFALYLTADHGNVTAEGVGNPKEGVLVETKGKRARVYDRAEFRDEVVAKFPDSIPWPNYGLPPDTHVLLAGDLKAFADTGSKIVAHGGIALEEVMVPFVEITRGEA